MSNYILSAERISKKYGGTAVLRDVSMNIKRGEIYGLIGQNGSGKTTLLRILTGQINAHCGSVAARSPDGSRCKISAVINSPSLFLNMSAYQNMKHQAILAGISDDTRIEKVLKTVGLIRSGKKPVKNFSLGMTQRLKLALALIENPDILILDEPTIGLDPNGISELREMLIELNRSLGITIIISSHILSELEQTATRIGILHDGAIVKELSTQDAFQNGETLEDVYLHHTRGGQ